MDAPTLAQLRGLLRYTLDWNDLVWTAAQHGLLPLLYQTLNQHCPEAVPPAVLKCLRNRFGQNARRNIALTTELLRLLRLLAKHDIRAIPYKGPALAVTVYGDPALRQFGDLDILVEKANALRAKELLAAEGYRLDGPITEAHKDLCPKAGNQHHFHLRREGRLAVELHWDVTSRYFLPALKTADLWQGLETASLLGETVSVFSAERLLLLLCIHGSKHTWERLEFGCGVAELIKGQPSLDWTPVLVEAARWRCRRPLLLGLHLACILFDAPLPAEVLKAIDADTTVGTLADEVMANLSDKPGTMRRLRFQLELPEGRRDKLRYGVSLVTAPTVFEWDWVRLPAAASFLYYLLRPVRLVRKYGFNRR